MQLKSELNRFNVCVSKQMSMQDMQIFVPSFFKQGALFGVFCQTDCREKYENLVVWRQSLPGELVRSKYPKNGLDYGEIVSREDDPALANRQPVALFDPRNNRVWFNKTERYSAFVNRLRLLFKVSKLSESLKRTAG